MMLPKTERLRSCLDHHSELHLGGGRSFEVRYGVDLSAIAARLWTESNQQRRAEI